MDVNTLLRLAVRQDAPTAHNHRTANTLVSSGLIGGKVGIVRESR